MTNFQIFVLVLLGAFLVTLSVIFYNASNKPKPATIIQTSPTVIPHVSTYCTYTYNLNHQINGKYCN